MTNRSNDDRDQCINMLVARVEKLEAEVARLKGEQELPVNTPPQKIVAMGTPGDIPSNSRQMEDLKSSENGSLESAIGTRWIGRVGIIAVLIGVAFFLKYSFDNRLIGEMGRIILGIFWGLAFIGAGEYFQKKKSMMLYGQILSGGGLAILYLALYAAFSLYHLIPVLLAAIGMIAVTTTGITLSVRYSTYSLAATALLGGFLTPIMLSTGQNQPLQLFGYILLLDCGTLLLLRFRRWPSLVAASLFATVLIYIGWHTRFFGGDQRWLAFGIVSAVFSFYSLYVVISRLHSKDQESTTDQAIIFGSSAFFFVAFFAQHRWECTWPVKVFVLALASLEIGMAELIRRLRPSFSLTIASFAATSVIMTVAGCFVVLEGRWILPALSAEMVVLGWIGFRLNRATIRFGAYLLGLIVLFKFAGDLRVVLQPFEHLTPLFNERFLSSAAAVVAFYIFTGFTARYRAMLQDNEQNVSVACFVITQALSIVLLSVELHDFFRFRTPGFVLGWSSANYAYQVSLSVLWALYASFITGVGIMKRLRHARLAGIVLLGASVLKVFLLDLSSLQTFYRIISFIVLGLLLLAVSYSYNRFKQFIFGGD
jgi:uncharacterized membrane protein